MAKIKISKPIITYVTIFTFLVLAYSLIFNYLMHNFEHKQYSFITAIYWVIMSMTTVGYGDIVFYSLIGQFYAIVVVLSGVVMIFGYFFPLVVTPQLEKALRKELPFRVPIDLKNHIIICGYNQLVETLIEELEEQGISFVIIDDNDKNINYLISKKIICVHGEASDENILLNSNIFSARMVIANQNDEKNAGIILTAKELCDIRVISLVEDIYKSGYLKYAGADKVISPKTLFGAYIGRKAVDPLTDHLAGATRFFENLNIVEFPIYPGSQLISKKLKYANPFRIHAGTYWISIRGLWTWKEDRSKM